MIQYVQTVTPTNDVLRRVLYYILGDECKVSCFLPNAKAVFDTYYSDVVHTRHEKPTRISEITCTALKKWSPNPRKILCKVECNEVREIPFFLNKHFCLLRT